MVTQSNSDMCYNNMKMLIPLTKFDVLKHNSTKILKTNCSIMLDKM